MRASAQPRYIRRSAVQNRRSKRPSLGRGFSLEDRELLPERSRFQCELVARYEERANVRDESNYERTHRSDVSRTASCRAEGAEFNLLMPLADVVLMTDSRP